MGVLDRLIVCGLVYVIGALAWALGFGSFMVLLSACAVVCATVLGVQWLYRVGLRRLAGEAPRGS